MPYKVEIKHVPSLPAFWRDVSDYIIDLGDTPFIARNDDYTRVDDYVDIKQSFTYGFQFDTNDQVLIWSGSTLLFNGVISEKKVDNEKFQYKYRVQDSLVKKLKLSSYQMTLTDMETYINTYAVSKTIYGKVPTNTLDKWIGVYDVIYAIMDKIGVTLDTSLLFYHGQQAWGWEFANPGSTGQIAATGSLLQIGTDTLYFWVPMLYCANQEKIWTANYIDIKPVLKAEAPSIYDVLSLLQGMLGIIFVPKSETEYYVISHTTGLPTRSPNYEFSAENTEDKPKYDGATLSYKAFYYTNTLHPEWQFSHLPFMPNTEPTDLPYLQEEFPVKYGYTHYVGDYNSQYGSLGKSKTELDWYNHLLIFEILPYYTGSHILRIPNATVGSKLTILQNSFNAALGFNYETVYENLLDTGYYSRLNENYQTIDITSGKVPSSKFLIKEFDISTI